MCVCIVATEIHRAGALAVSSETLIARRGDVAQLGYRYLRSLLRLRLRHFVVGVPQEVGQLDQVVSVGGRAVRLAVIIIIIWLVVDRQRQVRRRIHHHVRVYGSLRYVVVVLMLHVVRVFLLVEVISAGRSRDVVVIVIVIVLPVMHVQTLQSCYVVSVVLLLLLLGQAAVRLIVLRRGDVVVGIFQIAVTLRPRRAGGMCLAVVHVRQTSTGGQSVSSPGPVGSNYPVLAHYRRG